MARIPVSVLVGTLCLLASCSNSSSGGSSGGTTNPPDMLVYTENPANYQVGTTIADNTASVLGTVTNFSVSPALPTGLDLDVVTGVVSGTPTVARGVDVYTVTASNSAGVELATPGRMSRTSTVPDVLPSDFHSSVPLGPMARK